MTNPTIAHMLMAEQGSIDSSVMFFLAGLLERTVVVFYACWTSTVFWATVFGVTW